MPQSRTPSSSVDPWEDVVAATQESMAQASELVLGGFRLRTDGDKKIVKYPDRYVDDRGATMWNRVMKLLKELESGTA